jgi:RNA polymerase sigma-70 factor (ECF subfamily)
MSTTAMSEVASKLEQELELLFREHYQMLYRTAYGMLKNRSDAEDVPQTIFMRLLQGGLPTDFQRHSKRYLYRAAVNLSLDVIRARKRQKFTADVENLDVPIDASETDAAEETHRRLAEAVSELRPEAAEILMLRYVHSYTEREIAKLLGVSRGTIAIKLFRSRARLKKLMRTLVGGER